MTPQRTLFPAGLLMSAAALLAGCSEQAPTDRAAKGSTTPPYVRGEGEASPLASTVTPVRIGELGPSFAACNARGAVRDRAGAEVPVRIAPYQPAARIDSLAPDAQFFICSRTHDQRWFGIVYDEGGRASARCGVSAPVAERRDYQGPCAAGWVPSALIRLMSGAADQPEAPPVAPQ
jgi:hypothetical protein